MKGIRVSTDFEDIAMKLNIFLGSETFKSNHGFYLNLLITVYTVSKSVISTWSCTESF